MKKLYYNHKLLANFLHSNIGPLLLHPESNRNFSLLTCIHKSTWPCFCSLEHFVTWIDWMSCKIRRKWLFLIVHFLFTNNIFPLQQTVAYHKESVWGDYIHFSKFLFSFFIFLCSAINKGTTLLQLTYLIWFWCFTCTNV